MDEQREIAFHEVGDALGISFNGGMLGHIEINKLAAWLNSGLSENAKTAKDLLAEAVSKNRDALGKSMQNW